MKLLTILAISIVLLTASQAMEKPWFHTRGTRSLDCPVMKGIILCKGGSERIFFPIPGPMNSGGLLKK